MTLLQLSSFSSVSHFLLKEDSFMSHVRESRFTW